MLSSSSSPEVSGNITSMPSRKNVDICECIALISTIAAANCRSNASSAALLSVEVFSEGGAGVDVRVREEGDPRFWYQYQLMNDDEEVVDVHFIGCESRGKFRHRLGCR